MRLVTFACFFAVVLAGCTRVANDPGFAHHPIDCRLLGIPHEDCEPGTAGYRGDAQQQMAADLRAANDDAVCRSRGIPPESRDYIPCRINLYNQRALVSQN